MASAKTISDEVAADDNGISATAAVGDNAVLVIGGALHSGGSVTDFENKEILYGKKDFRNPSLILKSKNLV